MTSAPLTSEEPTLEASIEVDASPADVWMLLSDVTRMSKWSPQVLKTFLRGAPREGATFMNLNRRGLLLWPTNAKIVAFEPNRKLAFRIKENYTIWSFTLEPTESGGTRITERREAPRGISDLSLNLTKRFLGGKETFEKELVEGMAQTLARIKADLG